MTATPHKPVITAESAYRDAHRQARRSVARIGQLLIERVNRLGPRRTTDWAHVGALTEVNRRLTELVAFLESAEG